MQADPVMSGREPGQVLTLLAGRAHARLERLAATPARVGGATSWKRAAKAALPACARLLPKLLCTVDEVATIFGRAPETIRKLCW